MGKRLDASLSVTIPAFNEEETIEQVVEEALAAASSLTRDFEIVIVDDGSVDGTGALADKLASAHEPVRVVHHETNRGFSGAMQSCMASAAKELAFLSPADGQASYDDLARFWSKIDSADLVFSERAGRIDHWRRKAASRVWYAFLRIIFGMRVPQFSSSFLFRRDVVQKLDVRVRGDASNFLPVLFVSAKHSGYRVEVLPTIQTARAAGKPKGLTLPNVLRTVGEEVGLWWRLRVRGRRRRG